MFRPMLLFNGVKQKCFYEAKAAANEKLNKTSEACLKKKRYNENAATKMRNNEDTTLKFYMNIH